MRTTPPRPVTVETVTIPVGGGEMTALVAVPAAAPGRLPAVVVGFELFGTTAYVRRTAERLAAAGRVAIVPDFHHRAAPGWSAAADAQGRAEGLSLLGLLERDGVREDLRAVLEYLRRRPDTAGPVGMVGLSLGAHLAWFAAAEVPLAAAVLAYPGWLAAAGMGLSAAEPLLALTEGIARQGGRLLYLVGADDHVATPEQTRAVGEALTANAVPHEIVVYPDTPHGFLADERDTYRAGPAEDAWRRIEGFLSAALGAAPAIGPRLT